MNTSKYAIGVDFGTLSGRAVIVDLKDGMELATAVHEYADGVMGEDVFYTFAPGDALAVCTFYADSEVVGEFFIKVGDAGDLEFYTLSDDLDLWRVTKTVEGY